MPRSLRDVRTSYTYQPSARLHHCTYGVRVAASGVSHVVTANRATTGHRTSGMPGKITRLLACSAEQRAQLLAEPHRAQRRALWLADELLVPVSWLSHNLSM